MEDMNYSDGFIARQVRRMAGPDGISASGLAKDVGVPQPTLSRWLRAASSFEAMTRKPSKKDTTPRHKRWSPEEKLRVLGRAAQLGDDELGAFLRTEGLHEATLRQWQAAATAALMALSDRRSGKKSPDAKRIADLERDLRRKEKALAELAALITLQEKVQAIWGGRGRRHEHEERDLMLGLLDEAVAAGARLAPACEVVGLDPRTVQRWRVQCVGEDRRAGPVTKPRNALSSRERARIVGLVNSSRYRDKSPKQIVPLLADEGKYVGSESTMYRILRNESQVRHRSTSKAPEKRHRPQPYTATGPNQVWTWDITYLKSAVRRSFYYLYMTLDVWSRKIVGFEVHDVECARVAARMTAAACSAEGVREGTLVLHSDNGGPMKGATMLARLQELGVATSFSRPSVSNDNPFSESAFRTAKYRPDYPVRPFASVAEARAWARSFVRWYNEKHLHSSIRFVTPSDRHEGHEASIVKARAAVYDRARQRHPERWSCDTRNWSSVASVTLNPAPDLEVRAGA